MNNLHFVNVEDKLPAAHTTVLARGWGERKLHYVWSLAEYEKTTSCKRWVDASVWSRGDTLWFEPVEWASLPQSGQST